MHDQNIFHADLHLKNILLDSGMKPWLLDLDRSFHFKPLPQFLKDMNIKRFFRSCSKWSEKGIISPLSDYREIFLKGYNNPV
jgi:hypothetical protein